MQQLKRIGYSAALIMLMVQPLPAQKVIIFSAIKGSLSKPDTVPVTAKKIVFVSGDSSAFRIQSFKNGELIVVFKPAANFIGIARATLKAITYGKPVIIECTGLSTKGLEGENEAP